MVNNQQKQQYWKWCHPRRGNTFQICALCLMLLCFFYTTTTTRKYNEKQSQHKTKLCQAKQIFMKATAQRDSTIQKLENDLALASSLSYKVFIPAQCLLLKGLIFSNMFLSWYSFLSCSLCPALLLGEGADQRSDARKREAAGGEARAAEEDKWGRRHGQQRHEDGFHCPAQVAQSITTPEQQGSLQRD